MRQKAGGEYRRFPGNQLSSYFIVARKESIGVGFVRARS
jgi:hypothetical protein